MKLFTCPDETVFVLNQIQVVEPVVETGLPQCPLRFFVTFAGGGHGWYPTHDNAFPNIAKAGDSAWHRAYPVVHGIRNKLLEALEAL